MLKSSDFRVRVHTLNRPQRIYTVVYIPGPSTYWVVDAGEEEGDGIPFRWEAHPASAGDHQRRAAHRLARTVDEAEVATAATTARGVVVAGSRCFCRKLRHWRGRRGPTPDSMCKHNGGPMSYYIIVNQERDPGIIQFHIIYMIKPGHFR